MYTSGLRVAALALLIVAASAPTPIERIAQPDLPEPSPTVASEPPEAPEPVTTVSGDTADLEAEGWEAIRRLAAAGLDLPAIDLRVYGTTEPCRAPDGTGRVGVTIIYPDKYEVLSCGTMATLMHELAHVWDHHALDDATRQALLDLRGLDSWSHETWSKAGGEHLAAIVSWGLTGARQPMINPADDTSMAIAYELATGTQAPTLAERGLSLVDGRVRRGASVEAEPIAPAGPAFTADQHRLVEWATAQFQGAGLRLPDISIRFSEAAMDCNGHVGLYYSATEQLHLCRMDEHSILHELAHAWAHQNLTEDHRATFTSARGLDAWHDEEVEWSERGTEHAAEVIAWALQSENTLVRWVAPDRDSTSQWRLLTIPKSGPDQLAAAYELLTGMGPQQRLADDPRLAERQVVSSPEARRLTTHVPMKAES